MVDNLPAAHLEFFHNLKPIYLLRRLWFCTCRYSTGQANWNSKILEDLVWIREEFLYSALDHGRCIVHGHTFDATWIFSQIGIGIDTGAFFTNVLTCLVLERETVGILQTPPS